MGNFHATYTGAARRVIGESIFRPYFAQARKTAPPLRTAAPASDTVGAQEPPAHCHQTRQTANRANHPAASRERGGTASSKPIPTRAGRKRQTPNAKRRGAWVRSVCTCPCSHRVRCLIA